MRVLVCGSRDYADREELFSVMDLLNRQHRFTCVIEGGARGADTIAREWAEFRGIGVEEYPAEWNKYGRAAGPIRNKQMIDEGRPDFVVAFPKTLLSLSKGTRNMVEQAQKARIRTRVYES